VILSFLYLHEDFSKIKPKIATLIKTLGEA